MKPRIELAILPTPAEVTELRVRGFLQALARKPAMVYLGNTGQTPLGMYAELAARRADLSRLRVRMLDGWLLCPQRGFDSIQHPAAFTRYLQQHWLELLPPEQRPQDVVVLPEDLATCTQIDAALAEQDGAWFRPPHPLTGQPGAEIVVAETAGGVLAMVRRVCAAFDATLERDPPDIASLGVGGLPYPHMAFNNGPYTRREAVTHLTVTDPASRAGNAAAFGGTEAVPDYALTAGPTNILAARKLWLTACGVGKAQAVAAAFFDPRLPDHSLRGSITYALDHPSLSMAMDEAAASSLLAEGGLKGLQQRYAEAGLELVV